MPIDIQKLADEALSSVREPEVVKTASTKPQYRTEVAAAIKEAAQVLRDSELHAVTLNDVHNVIDGTQLKVASAELPNEGANDLANELRKLAYVLRTESADVAAVRREKAAHMLNASIGLQHLLSEVD